MVPLKCTLLKGMDALNPSEAPNLRKTPQTHIGRSLTPTAEISLSWKKGDSSEGIFPLAIYVMIAASKVVTEFSRSEGFGFERPVNANRCS